MKPSPLVPVLALAASALFVLPADAKKKRPKTTVPDPGPCQISFHYNNNTNLSPYTYYTDNQSCANSCPITQSNTNYWGVNFSIVMNQFRYTLPTSVTNDINAGKISYIECHEPDGTIYASTQTGGLVTSGSASSVVSAWAMGVAGLVSAVFVAVL